MVPEVNRNKNIGERGANMNANYFKTYLASMNWAEQGVGEEGFGDLAYLTGKGPYRAGMTQLLAAATPWLGGSLKETALDPGQVCGALLQSRVADRWTRNSNRII